MVKDLSSKKNDSSMVEDRESIVKEIYNCEENPLSYMIEPKGSVKIVDENKKTKKEDLANIL